VVDDIIVMYAGRIVERLPAENVVEAAQMPYTRALISAVPAMAEESALPVPIRGTPPDPRDLPPGCPFSARCAVVIDRCHEEEPPLFAVGERRSSACWHATENALASTAAAGLPQ
jgi:oligopeptide/dipeptide ABC transporter ATP-binding protein